VTAAAEIRLTVPDDASVAVRPPNAYTWFPSAATAASCNGAGRTPIVDATRCGADRAVFEAASAGVAVLADCPPCVGTPVARAGVWPPPNCLSTMPRRTTSTAAATIAAVSLRRSSS